MTQPTIPESDLQAILQRIEQLTGLCYRQDQMTSVTKTIQRLMQQSNIDQPREFLRAINTCPDVFQRLVDEITVGESYFFRESRHFDFIRDHVLPERCRARPLGQIIRIWSAACSAGEEAYSLAIVCAQQNLTDRVDILATDISPRAIAKARTGSFRDWSFRGNAMSIVQPYLDRSDGLWTVNDKIRRSVRFQTLNLASDSFPSAARGITQLDLILCRNVLIYFHTEMIRELAKRLFDSLAPGGWLITASADPPLTGLAPFESVETEFGFFCRKPLAGEGRKPAGPAKTVPSESAPKRDHPTSPGGHRGVKWNAKGPAKLEPAGTAVKPNSVRSTNSLALRPTTARAAEALSAGNYPEAIRLTADQLRDAEACAIHVKATAETDAAIALEKCTWAAQTHPLSAELHFLHAGLLMEAGRLDQAFQAVQKALFLDRSAVMVHFLFGSIQLQRGQWASAYRHFRNVRELCRTSRPHDTLPLSAGETVAHVVAAAESQMARIKLD